MKCFPLLILFLFTVARLLAQTPAQYIAKGDQEQEQGFPNAAIFYYNHALSLDTQLAEAHFKMGEAYRSMRYYNKASTYYKAALQYDERGYPEAMFYLGLMQKQTGNYRDAKRSFQKFQETYRRRDLFYRWAAQEETSTQWAIEHSKDTARYKIMHLDSGLNTVHSEMSPFPVGDSLLFFASLRTEEEIVRKNNPVFVEILQAKKDSGTWEVTGPELPLGDGMHMANGVFSPDSSRFYFSRCPSMLACEIMVTEKINGNWSTPQPLPSPVNDGTSNNTQPMVAKGEKFDILVFASDRSNGKGGMDLWYVELNQDGSVRPRIRSLGSRINTQGDELTPWFDSSDTTFYFASNWHEGFGGFDIFSSKGFPGNLSIIQNLGTGINTVADDYYFTFHAKDSTGYFASNRNGGYSKDQELCCNDIYKAIKLKERKIIIPPADSIPPPDTLEPIPATVAEVQSYLPLTLYFDNDQPDPGTTKTSTAQTYSETFTAYMALAPTYFDALKNTTLDSIARDSLHSELNHFFDQEAGRGMDRLERVAGVLLRELSDSAKIELVVKGYASPLAAKDYNYNLTQRRISSLVNYLRKYENGALVPFLESGQLSIEREPYGETQARESISDDRNRLFDAVYSPAAAMERRIEILKIEKQAD